MGMVENLFEAAFNIAAAAVNAVKAMPEGLNNESVFQRLPQS